jgi:FAD-dependent oxidoreductase domain-containing protein 1
METVRSDGPRRFRFDGTCQSCHWHFSLARATTSEVVGQGAEMASEQVFDVVVIGGAVMGCSVAYWLTRMQPGLSILVVERDPTFAQAATALSVASIRQQFTTRVNVEISRFGIGFLRDFQANLGHDVGIGSLGLKENGYLFLTGSEAGAAMLAEVAKMQRSLGAATQILTPDEIASRFPWLETGDLTAGSFGPRDEGWFDNMGLLAGFRAAAKAQGAHFVTDLAIGLDVAAGRVKGVKLEKGGTVFCGAVVNAAGTRASEICKMAGLSLPVEPRKRTVFVVDAPNARHAEAPLLVDAGFYLRPEDRHWITATVPETDGPCDINDFDPDLHLFEEVIWEQLYNRAHGFDAVKVVRHWVGHYDYNTLDQNAILGPHPDLPNLYLMNGFSGHGLQQSPAVGRGVAEHILTNAWQSIDLSDLSAARVLNCTPFRERAVV